MGGPFFLDITIDPNFVIVDCFAPKTRPGGRVFAPYSVKIIGTLTMADEPKARYLVNRAAQANAPHIILLQGPGPFQLPRLGSDVNYLALESGAIEIRLETELGQGVRIILPELGAATLRSLLVAAFRRRVAGKEGG